MVGGGGSVGGQALLPWGGAGAVLLLPHQGVFPLHGGDGGQAGGLAALVLSLL